MSAAEELRKRDLKRDEAKGWNRNDDQDGKSKKENERKKSVMKEMDKLRNWDPAWEHQTTVQIMGDSSLSERKVENKRSKIQSRGAKVTESVGQTDIRPMADHLNLFQHLQRLEGESGSSYA